MSVVLLGMKGMGSSVGHLIGKSVVSQVSGRFHVAQGQEVSNLMKRTNRNFVTVVKEYEKGVTFSLGKLTSVKDPGLRIVIPIFQDMVKVDMRSDLIPLSKQEVITEDNVSIMVDAVVQFHLIDAKKAVCSVNNYKEAISELAQLKLRETLSKSDINNILHDRTQFSDKALEVSIVQAREWGIELKAISIKDIKFCHEGVVRAMAKVAEAKREADAQIIAAQAEVKTAKEYAKAAGILASSKGAFKLRELETLLQISKEEGNNFILYPAGIGTHLEGAQEAIVKMAKNLKSTEVTSLLNPNTNKETT